MSRPAGARASKRTKTVSSPFSRATGATGATGRDLVSAVADDFGQGLDSAVVALIESRSREVGLAGVHRRSMDFELTQFSDSASYSRTISAVLAADPSAVLVSRSARGTQLVQLLEKALKGGSCHLTFLERRHFDEAEGQSLLEEAIVVGLQQADFSSKFAAAASFTALWRYIESSSDVRLVTSSCRVTFRVASDICMVDSSTVRLLDLVSSHRRSVLGLFKTVTSQGTQMLRQAILQPSAKLPEIQKRHAAVEALLEDHLLERVQQLLPGVGDLDLLVARLTTEPRQRGMQWYKVAVRTALRLRHALSALPHLADALSPKSRRCQEASAGHLDDLHEVLSHSFAKQLQELDRILDDTPPGRGSMAHAALMYAVKPNVNALLDVARQTWTEALEQIHSLFRTLTLKYPDLNLKLEFAEKKGWYLSHERAAVPELLQTMPRGGRFSSSTRELNSENFKLHQAEGEILRRNVEVLAELFAQLRAEALQLHAAAQAVGFLDMLCAFAGYTKVTGAVKPELTEDPNAPMAVKAGRHPTLEVILAESGQHFEPVDFFLGESCFFQIVTGHNGGGKSTYLQTLAQLVILAQIGCFLPAHYASLRISSSLFTRMGTSDSIEASASSFLIEMKEASHILSSVASDSLVLIDELGRGTAHADGLAICWAVCEKLLDLNVRCLFATHYFELCHLQARAPGLRNLHLELVVAAGDAGDAGDAGVAAARFVVQHISSLEALQLKGQSRYGLKAALCSGIPKDLVKRAETMVVQVDSALKLCEDSWNSYTEDETAAEATLRQLLALGRTAPTASALADILRELQKPWLEKVE